MLFVLGYHRKLPFNYECLQTLKPQVLTLVSTESKIVLYDLHDHLLPISVYMFVCFDNVFV